MTVGDDSTNLHAERARRGDGDGFAELYRRLAPTLSVWAALRVNVRLRAQIDPEDLVQEVWWRAMDSFSTFDRDRGAFRSWMFKIATNVLIDRYRSLAAHRGRMEANRGRIDDSASPQLVAEITSISRQAARRDDVREVIEAVSRLDEGDRALFIHCAIEGKKPTEAGRLLGMTDAAAIKRWQRLRTRLRAASVFAEPG